MRPCGRTAFYRRRADPNRRGRLQHATATLPEQGPTKSRAPGGAAGSRPRPPASRAAGASTSSRSRSRVPAAATPGQPGVQHEQDPAQSLAVITPRPTPTVRAHRMLRQQRLYTTPQIVSDNPRARTRRYTSTTADQTPPVTRIRTSSYLLMCLSSVPWRRVPFPLQPNRAVEVRPLNHARPGFD
jgi:hypothetical protein